MQNDLALKTFAAFKVIMIHQYLDLEAISGLMVQNFSLNMMQELKNSQEKLLNTLKAEVQNGCQETMQALSLSANQENVNTNHC